MTVFLITLAIFAIAFAGMAIGVIISNRRLRGSCGGLAGLTDASGSTLCDACSNPSDACTGIKSARRRANAESHPEPSSSTPPTSFD